MQGRRQSKDRALFRRLETVLFAIFTYVPFFLSEPGRISADTKAYLYLDPQHLLATATSMWNADQGFGMVTHQNIGYLFPMGPYFWLAHSAHVPVWIAQRFWMGSLLFLAGIGVRRLAVEMGLTRYAAWLAAIPYTLTPFILVNIGRTSAILMPWAGLGFMMLYVIRATRTRGWANPAKFALVVALVGGVNATSILLVGLAPALWLLYAAVTKEISPSVAITTAARVGILSGLVSVWWAAGLWAEGKYGIDILRYTETIPTVASTSSSSEVFRGLGYWYFYGWDHAQLWTSASAGYMNGQLTPFASVVVPTIGFLAAFFVQWRYRLFAVIVTVVGIAIAVGAYPYNSPTPAGSALKWLGENTTVGLAMRSTNRVAPIIILGLGLLVGAGFDALRQFDKSHLKTLFAGVTAFSLVAMLPLYTGRALANNLSSPSRLPAYVNQAAASLNAESANGGVLGLAGLDFGYYRWGAYVDSVWPGLLHRPFVTSQITLQGEPASVNLVRALDGTLQDRIAEPATIAPIARLLGTGDVLLELDGQYERFNSPEPWYLWNVLNSKQADLVRTGTFGPVRQDHVPDGRYINESNLGLPATYVWPPSLATYHVANVRPLVRTESNNAPVIVAGDGEGLVAMAALHILPDANPIFYEGSLDATQLSHLTDIPGSSLVLTDSNQLRENAYGILSASPGFVEQASVPNLNTNSAQQPLYAFAPKASGTQTVAILTGVRSVQASSYGNPISNNPEVQAYYALDGDPTTAWQTSAFYNALGEFLDITFPTSHTIAHFHVQQPSDATTNRWITKIAISVNGRQVAVRTLNQASRGRDGQEIDIPPTFGDHVRLTIAGTTGSQSNLGNASSVGFSEVTFPFLPPVTHSLLLPTSLLSRANAASGLNDLSIVMTRARAATTPPRLDPERYLDRTFVLPAGRTFSLEALGSLNPAASDTTLEHLLRIHPTTGNAVMATDASTRLVGSLNMASWAAFDGSNETSWQPSFQTGSGQWVSETSTSALSLSNFDLTIINDGEHMVPTSIIVSSGHQAETVSTGLTINRARPRGQLQTVHLRVPSMVGRTFRFKVGSFLPVTVVDRISGVANHPPVAISEISIPGLHPLAIPNGFDSGCLTNLLSIDGANIPLRVSGNGSDALNQSELRVETCSGTPIALTSGTHHVVSSPGALSGINVDHLLLHSSPNQSPGGAGGAVLDDQGVWTSRSRVSARLTSASAGQWVVLGQSFSEGWHASLNGVDLGAPTLIDGASMGWQLPSQIPDRSRIEFEWKPQNIVYGALALSATAFFTLCYLALPRRRNQERHVVEAPVTAVRSFSARVPTILTYVLAALLGCLVSWWLIPGLLAVVAFVHRRPSSIGVFAALASVLIVAGDAATVVASRMHITRGISWPQQVPYANGLTWCALVTWCLVLTLSSSNAPIRSKGTPTMTQPNTPRTVTRRRGLNVSQPVAVTADPSTSLQQLVVAPRGPLRIFALVRAVLVKRRNAALYSEIMSVDAMNQVIGNVPLFNRQVLEIADVGTSFAESFALRGAHVTTMRRQVPPQRRGYAPEETPLANDILYTPLQIPAPDGAFDVIFATNVMSSVEDPTVLLREIIRVAKPGATIHIQNAVWYSPWGGRETSPWHLFSGEYARRRYLRKHGRNPVNAYGLTLFKVTVRQLNQALLHNRQLTPIAFHPRYLNPSFHWLLKIPVLREVLTVNVVYLLEKKA